MIEMIVKYKQTAIDDHFSAAMGKDSESSFYAHSLL